MGKQKINDLDKVLRGVLFHGTSPDFEQAMNKLYRIYKADSLRNGGYSTLSLGEAYEDLNAIEADAYRRYNGHVHYCFDMNSDGSYAPTIVYKRLMEE